MPDDMTKAEAGVKGFTAQATGEGIIIKYVAQQYPGSLIQVVTMMSITEADALCQMISSSIARVKV